MLTLVTILQLLAGVALVLAVLFQSGKESGLSGAIAGNSESYMSKSKNGGLDKMLAKATKWIGAAFIVLTMVRPMLEKEAKAEAAK